MDTKSSSVIKATDVANKVFSVFYIIEVALRIDSLRQTYFTSPVEVVDFLLVIISVLDSWTTVSLSAFRLLRLLRLVRLARISRKVSWLIADSLVHSIRLIIWTFILLALAVYVVSLISSYWLSGETSEYFDKVWKSTFTFFQFVFGRSDVETILRPLTSLWAQLGLLVFIWITRYGLLNIVLGLVVANVYTVSRKLQSVKQSERSVKESCMMRSLEKCFVRIDVDGSKSISRNELIAAMSQPDILRLMVDLEIPVMEPDKLFSLMDIDRSGEIAFEEFMGGIAKIKRRAKGADMLKVKLRLKNLWRSVSGQEIGAEHVLLKSEEILRRTRDMYERLDVFGRESSDPVIRMRYTGVIRR